MQERGTVAPLTAGRLRIPALMVVVVTLVVAVDQATKTWALHALSDRTIHLFWTLQLNLTLNSGVAFGLGKGVTPVLVVVAVAMLVTVMILGQYHTDPTRAVAMALLLAGAGSNLIDRLVRSHGGAVIDWIDAQWWPVFNVADMALTCGVLLLVLTTWRQSGERGA